jgi:hypothetical protein
MRTTVTIPDFTYREIKELADERHESTSEVLQLLVMRGLRQFRPLHPAVDPETGNHYMAGGPKLTLAESMQLTQQIKDDDDR